MNDNIENKLPSNVNGEGSVAGSSKMKLQKFQDSLFHKVTFSFALLVLLVLAGIVGSLFYGVILGIFLVAFWIKRVGANAVFFSAVISELMIITIYKADIVSFLWLNVIGALLVIGIALLIQPFIPAKK